jgi:hypothetical protein
MREPSRLAQMAPGRVSKTTLAAALYVGTAIWLSLGILALTDADGAHRVGVLPPVWLLGIIIFVAIATAGVARPSWHGGLPLLLLLVLVLPWLPLPVPALFLLWTGPVAVLVWGAAALCVAAMVAVSTVGKRGHVSLGDARKAPRVAALLAFVVFFAVRLGRPGPPSGDEPHYLVIAQSLLGDGDVSVLNNYRNGDYLRYYPGALRPHFTGMEVNGRRYSLHAPGLPALVAPAFGVGGYWAVVAWVAALVALGSALVWKAAYIFTRDSGAAWFGWASVALTAPVVLHGPLVYPDGVAGTLVAAGVVALALASDQSRTAPAIERQTSDRVLPWPLAGSVGAGIAVGLLPWLHVRLALPAAFLGVAILLRIARTFPPRAGWWRDAAAFAAPVVVSVASWIAFYRIHYGSFNPAASFGTGTLDVSRVPVGMLGLMADQEFGLLANAPIHLLWLGGFWTIFKRDRRLAIELLLIVGPYAIASSAYQSWWGGASPPARFLVPIVFPLGVALAALWARQDHRGRTVSMVLLGVSVLIAAALAFGGDGALAYSGGTGRARLLDWLSPLVDLPRGFPSFFRAARSGIAGGSSMVAELVIPAMLWGGALLVGWIVFRALVTRLPATLPAGLVVAAACFAGVLSLAVQAAWSLHGGTHLLSTRGQLGLLSREDVRLRPLGVQLPPLHVFPAAEARTRLALTTSPLDTTARNMLLFLAEVAPGDYRLRVTRKALARGELLLGIGRNTRPVERWSLADGQIDTWSFYLPIRASTIVVTGDEEALGSVERIALVPAPRSHATGPATLRARDAARYGSVVVYATDDFIWLEPEGFWIRGENQADVVIATDKPVAALDLEVRNVSTPNVVRLRTGGQSTDGALAADERWPVSMPVADLGPAIVLGVTVESGVRVRDRLLGSFVTVR